jgi:hypothetical protein
VLENEDFIKWATENVVVVMGHDGATGNNEPHKPLEVEDPKTHEKKQVCPLYPGMTCDQHKALRRDAQAGGKDGLGKIDVPGGFPNTWMVGPDGKVERIDGAKQQAAGSVMDALIAFQKTYPEKPILRKRWEEYQKALEEADKTLEEGKWKSVLAALAKVDKDAKKLTPALTAKVKEKADALNAKVVEKFGSIKDGDGDAAAKLKAVRALRSDVSAKLSAGALAVVTDLDAWIKEAAAAAAPAPAAGGK